MSNFMNIELFGEPHDVPCKPTKTNMVVKTKHNGFKLAEDAGFDDWELGIVFPDDELASYFLTRFDIHGHLDYRDGMLPGEYFFHIIYFTYPKKERLYADQLKMIKSW